MMYFIIFKSNNEYIEYALQSYAIKYSDNGKLGAIICNELTYSRYSIVGKLKSLIRYKYHKIVYLKYTL